jgi:hypothetical protein
MKQPATLSELLDRTSKIDWLSRVGQTDEVSGVVFWRSPDHWRATVESSWRAGSLAGSPRTEDGRAFGWLMPDQYEHDESFRAAMNGLRASGKGSDLQEVVRASYERVLSSITGRIPTSPWFEFGRVPSESLVLNLATFAVGQAGKEVYAEVGSFWRQVFALYELGHLPVGKLTGSGEIVTV